MTDDTTDVAADAEVLADATDATADTALETAEAGAWLSGSQAIAILGISQRTLDRRAKDGEIDRRRITGGRVEFWVARNAAVAPDGGGGGGSQGPASLALVDRLNLAVNQQVAPLVDLVERQQATIAEQAQQIGRLQAELDAARQVATDVAVTHEMRPWWRRWFG